MTKQHQLMCDIQRTSTDSDLGELLRRVARPVIQSLARGEPVSIEYLRAGAGFSSAELERGLRAMSDVEWDANGRVVALGLTWQPTEHALEVNGRTIYACCAFDTFLIAALLGQPVVIRSRAHRSKQAIRVVLTTDAVAELEPANTMVSWVGEQGPDQLSVLRESYCRHIHFFSSPMAAETWLRDHPHGFTLSVAEAYAAARQLAAEYFLEPNTSAARAAR